MMKWMDLKGLFLWALVLCGVALTAPPMSRAQDAEPVADTGAEADTGADADADTDADADAGSDADADAGADSDADADVPTEAASDAKRVVRIRRVITLDKEHIAWLRRELRSRTQWFEDLAAGMEDLSKERGEKRAELETMEADPEADPEELAKLRQEIDELQEDYELFDTQTDLALNAEKIIREQIGALEAKLIKEEHALGRLTGEIPAELPPSEAADAAAAEQETPKSGAKPAPLPLPIPGMPTSAAAPEKEQETSSIMTAAQLQASKALERKLHEVELAKQELDEFIERKRALQRQIEFEKEIEQGDEKEIENLKAALQTMEARLEKYVEQGRSKERISRRERGNRDLAKFIKEAERAGSKRSEYIESLNTRLLHLEEAQLRITEEVDEAQEEAEKAQRHMMWLESPIHPENIAHWAKERGPRILLVIFAAFFLLLFVQLSARRIARTVVRRRRGDRSEGTGRADTLAFSFQSASRVLIVVFGVLLVLQEAGVDIKTVLGGAAIVGVAIAFGAQDLMKDYFSGFLILLEDQYQLGDLITIGGVTGTVESVNMRVTVLRDLEGRVHFVPNGSIDHVTNRTYAWGRPVFEIPVRFDEDVDRVMETLVEVAKELSEDPAWKGSIIGDPEMLGVDKFSEYGVIIKFMVKTQPDKLFPVRRQMLRRITKRFNELGIQITVPQRLLVRDGPDGEAL